MHALLLFNISISTDDYESILLRRLAQWEIQKSLFEDVAGKWRDEECRRYPAEDGA